MVMVNLRSWNLPWRGSESIEVNEGGTVQGFSPVLNRLLERMRKGICMVKREMESMHAQFKKCQVYLALSCIYTLSSSVIE